MDDLLVSVDQGKLRGKKSTDDEGGSYYIFHGIPYAKPPVGKLRFKAPQPPENWSGVRDATVEGSESFSRHLFSRTVVGSEDCLTLNVYTKNLPKDNVPLKAVMVWIHGGAFIAGSSKIELFGPDYLITEDVVVVTINYRLGLLGFLSIDDPSLGVPGNAACKDMVLALKWVQKNISNFCGDSSNVTIFGESAGASAAHLLMLSPMAKGLFHKVIAQSGSALGPWAVGKGCAKEVAKSLGCNSENNKEILEFLQEIPVEKLFKAQELLKNHCRACVVRPVAPVIEKISPNEPAFLSENPLDIILQGKYNKVPLLMGFTSKEGICFDIIEKRSGESQIVKDFEDAIPHFLKLKRGSSLSRELAEKIKKFYYGNQEPSEENREPFYLLQTDVIFARGVYSSVRNHVVTSSTPVYLYRFSVDASLNIYKKLGNVKARGASHADDLGYLFKMSITPDKIDPNCIEGKTIYRMKKMWTNFARTGNPTPSTTDPLVNVKWEPVTSKRINFMDIGEELVPEVNPESARMEFWDEIYKLASSF